MTPNHSILIVGVGSIGERHLRCFQSLGNVSLSICEINPQLRQEVAQRYEIQQTYEDLATALRDRHTAAVIATPANTHIPLARQAAEAGLHLMIEKPLSTTMDGLADLAAMVREKNLVTNVAYVFRVDPALTAMRRELHSGRFGKPVHAVATCGQNFPTYRPAYREIYYSDRARGGGAIQDGLTHVFNAVQWLVGPVTAIAVDAAHRVLDGVEVEDTVNVIARHASEQTGETMVSYGYNQYQPNNEFVITVNCERGTVRFEAHRRRWRWMTTPDSQWRHEEFPLEDRDAMFKLQARAYLDAVEGRSPVLCSLDEGIQTLAVNLAAIESAAQRKWLKPDVDIEKK